MPAPYITIFGSVKLTRIPSKMYYGNLGHNSVAVKVDNLDDNTRAEVSVNCTICGECDFKTFKCTMAIARVESAIARHVCKGCKLAQQPDAESILEAQFQEFIRVDAKRSQGIATIMFTPPAKTMHPWDLRRSGLIITTHASYQGALYAQRVRISDSSPPYSICTLVVPDSDASKIARLLKLLRTDQLLVDHFAHTTRIGTLPGVILPPPLEPAWLTRHLEDLARRRTRLQNRQRQLRKTA